MWHVKAQVEAQRCQMIDMAERERHRPAEAPKPGTLDSRLHRGTHVNTIGVEDIEKFQIKEYRYAYKDTGARSVIPSLRGKPSASRSSEAQDNRLGSMLMSPA